MVAFYIMFQAFLQQHTVILWMFFSIKQEFWLACGDLLVSTKLSASHDFILTYLLNSLKAVLCIPNRNTSFRKSAPNIMVDKMRAFLFLVVLSSHPTRESLKALEQTYLVVYNDKCVQTFSYSNPYFLLFNLAKILVISVIAIPHYGPLNVTDQFFCSWQNENTVYTSIFPCAWTTITCK